MPMLENPSKLLCYQLHSDVLRIVSLFIERTALTQTQTCFKQPLQFLQKVG